MVCVDFGISTMLRTVDDSWWLIGGIAAISYLLVKLFKDDGYVAMNTSILAIILGAIIFTTNFYFPISVQHRQAVIQDVYDSGAKMYTCRPTTLSKGLLLQCKRITFGGQKDSFYNAKGLHLKRRKILLPREGTIATSRDSKKKPETKRFRAQTI